jgi:TPR repeat protein
MSNDCITLETCLDTSRRGSINHHYYLDYTGEQMCEACFLALRVPEDGAKGVLLISRATGKQKWLDPSTPIRFQGVCEGDTVVYTTYTQTADVIRLNTLTKIEDIGRGSYGKVYSARQSGSGRIVAVKLLDAWNFDPDFEKNFRREVEILSSVSHPTVVKFIGYLPEDASSGYPPAIITEYMDGGSLQQQIDKENSGKTGPEWNGTRKHIVLYGIALGMSVLHSKRVLHRDLKPANVLLTADLEPKIADFGTSKFINPMATNLQSVTAGTPCFMAPEIIDGDDYAFPVDVYAYAMVAYMVLSGRTPFAGERQWALTRRVVAGGRPAIPEFVPKQYQQLIQNCWRQEPEGRPTFDQIVAQLASRTFLTGDIDDSAFAAYHAKISPSAPRISSPPRSPQPQSPGRPSPERPNSALERLVEDAERGNCESQVDLGIRFLSGQGVPSSDDRACYWLERAAKGGSPRGMAEYARLLRRLGRSRDALTWFHKAVELGNAGAAFDIADMFERGDGTACDPRGAARLLIRAAELGHSRAQLRIGLAFEKGQLGLERNHAKAMEYYKMASDQGDPEGMFNYAEILESGKGVPMDVNRAVMLYRMSAQKGHTPAIAWYGTLMMHGRHVPQQIEQGKALIKLAIDRGLVAAHRDLAQAAEEGIGMEVDMFEAFRHYRIAAEGGNIYSGIKMARMLREGVGCQRAPEAAAVVLRKLINEQRSMEALVEYGLMLFKGTGVPRDVDLAKQCLQTAARNGIARATEYLAEIESTKPRQIEIGPLPAGSYHFQFD